jgi:hypothetical protein
LLRQTEAHNAVLIEGQGHQYHDGKEGTNASQAEARIVRFVDQGEVVWWASDATQAYQLANADIDLVTRSVLFIKPNLVILFDQVWKKRLDSRVSARFHPDNRDGRAEIEIGDTGGDFLIRRPEALLYGHSIASVGIQLAEGVLDVPKDRGAFPYLEVASHSAMRVELVTVLCVQPKARQERPRIAIRRSGTNWAVQAEDQEITLKVTGRIPEFQRTG